MTYFSSLQSNKFFPLGWLLDISYPKGSYKSQSPWVLDHSCWEGQNIWFNIWSVRQCKQGRPPKLALSNAERTVVSWVVTGLDLLLCWNHFGKHRPRIQSFMQHVGWCMQGRPPTLVPTGDFLPFSSISKSWRNWNSSTIMRKYNWWLISLFKQYFWF